MSTDNKSERKKIKKPFFWKILSKNFWSFTVLIIIVISFLFYYLWFSGVLENTKNKELLIETTKENIKKSNIELVETQKIIEKFVVLENYDLSKLYKMVPLGENIPDILVQLESLAVRSGINITGIDIKKEIIKENKNNGSNRKSFVGGLAGLLPEIFTEEINFDTLNSKLHRLNVNVKVSGTNNYFAIKNFLYSLERNLRLTDVKSFSYSSSSEEYSFILKMYYLEK